MSDIDVQYAYFLFHNCLEFFRFFHDVFSFIIVISIVARKFNVPTTHEGTFNFIDENIGFSRRFHFVHVDVASRVDSLRFSCANKELSSRTRYDDILRKCLLHLVGVKKNHISLLKKVRLTVATIVCARARAGLMCI